MGFVQRLWYGQSLLAWLLFPLSLVFGAISLTRRWLFRSGLKSSSKPEAFVIVVGNITVGGNGKTPVVLSVVEHFRAKGIPVGVLSRGYGGTMTSHPHHVKPDDQASLVGDEPSLIARRTGVPVVIDPVRARGAAKLAGELGCNIIVCDDGLQHYALKRDLELVVMDKRLVGNGHLMPMGPLREKTDRLGTVDAIILNGDVDIDSLSTSVMLPETYQFALSGERFCKVSDVSVTRKAVDFSGESVTAMAGIGHPQRFFNQLNAMGIHTSDCIAFADHYHFQHSDVPAGTVLMTEKDAVKVHGFAHDNCWYLPVEANFPLSFYAFLDRRYANYCEEKQ